MSEFLIENICGTICYLKLRDLPKTEWEFINVKPMKFFYSKGLRCCQWMQICAKRLKFYNILKKRAKPLVEIRNSTCDITDIHLWNYLMKF